MSVDGLSSGAEALREAAKKYFQNTYQNPPIKVGAVIDPQVSWAPSLQININNHLNVIVEVSEKPYPMIFNMRRTDVERLQQPISIFCACPEEAFLDNQADVKRLKEDGYGLLTVDQFGDVHLRENCVPIIQQIHDALFKEEIRPLSAALKRRVAESFVRYTQNPGSGVADISEVIEGLIIRAGQEAEKKGWINNGALGTPHATLVAMNASNNCANARAAIGAAQGFVSMYRNTSHHFPKNKKQAARKYRDCRHAFLEGIKKIDMFSTAMKNLGLSGALPK